MLQRPLIGVPVERENNVDIPDKDQNVLFSPYTDAVVRAGGVPVLIPVSADHGYLAELYDHLDGVMLPGSEDIPPAHFGQEPHPASSLMPEVQHEVWSALVKLALAKPKPLLAICGGMQVINVTLGGTLIQDIPSQTESTVCHHIHRRPDATHDAVVDSSSRLGGIFGAERVLINSAHHQATDRLGDGLVITARCPDDDIVEAFEMPDHPYLIAVQWHPERHHHGDSSKRLFDSFIAACR